MLARKGVDLFRVLAVVGRDGAVELDQHARALQRKDRAHRALICARVAAERAVGLRRRAVERDVHARGRVCRQKLHHSVVHQRRVRVDGHHQPHALAARVDLAEVRPQQRLAAREQEQQRALAAAFLRQRQPFTGGRLVPQRLGVVLAAVDVAHPAVKIAARRQLKRAGQRHAAAARLGKKKLAVCLIGVHVHLLILVQKSARRGPLPAPARRPRARPACTRARTPARTRQGQAAGSAPRATPP